MNKIIRLLIVIIFTFFVSSSSIAQGPDYGGTGVATNPGPNPNNMISMDFQDANLKTVLKIFSQQSGLNFVASQNVQDRTVTIYFEGVTVEDALNHIMSANNLIYEQAPGSSIFIVKESGKPAIETITKIYELKYAQLSPPPPIEGKDTDEGPQIIAVMEGVLSENGKLVADKRSNSLIITDVPSQFSIVEDVLARLDVRTAQVMIEAEIIETTTTIADTLGVNWSGTLGLYTGPSAYTVWPLRGKFGKQPDKASDAYEEGIKTEGSFSMTGLTASIKALMSDTDTRILARPRILTLNNETASIELTAETAVAITTETTDTGGATPTSKTTPEWKDTGISLNVTPQINKDGYITLHLEPEVIVPVKSKFGLQADGQTIVDTQTKKTNTTVMVKDGETIVIGGLISKEDSYVFNKVPFLGDIPLLGLAFRYKSTDEVDKELLIFITPHIVEDTTYAFGGVSEREQEIPKLKEKKDIKGVKEKEINTIMDLFVTR